MQNGSAYIKHQRDYSVLGTSVVFHAYHSRRVNSLFGVAYQPYYILVESDILYHFLPESESRARAISYADRYSLSEVKQQKLAHDHILSEYRSFIQDSVLLGARTFERLFTYFEQLLPLILAAIEVPEYAPSVSLKMNQLCLRIRQENENVYKAGFDKLAELLSSIEIEKSLPQGCLGYLTQQEFFNFLSGGYLEDRLSSRPAFVLIKQDGPREEIYYDKNLLKDLGLLTPSRASHDGILRGTIAQPGNVSGQVRLIRKVTDVDNLIAGEILVAAMTDPRHLVALHKAAAIVTDEGGVMCHAAIVARELNKPCIIGTRAATQVLNDGDLVEVDADSGRVIIIKSSGNF